MVEEALKVCQLNVDTFEAYAPGRRATNIVLQCQLLIRGQHSLGFRFALALFEIQRNMVAQLQKRQASPMGKMKLNLYLEGAAGPERVHATARIAELTPNAQSGDDQFHAHGEEQPFAEEP